jgi:hypothetical protein
MVAYFQGVAAAETKHIHDVVEDRLHRGQCVDLQDGFYNFVSCSSCNPESLVYPKSDRHDLQMLFLPEV